MKYIENILSKYNAVIAGDTEFANKLLLPTSYKSFKEYKKIICKTKFVLVQLQKYGEPTRIFEHPDMALGLLPSWKSNCVLVDLLGLSEVFSPREQWKENYDEKVNIAYTKIEEKEKKLLERKQKLDSSKNKNTQAYQKSFESLKLKFEKLEEEKEDFLYKTNNRKENFDTRNIKQFPIAYFFYFSAFDVFGLFRTKESQIKIAKQLLGGRVLREASFPNCLRTGIFVEVENEDGDTEIKEISIKLFDAKGYTPAGAKGLQGTFDTWGVPFANKDWKKFFNITKFDEEYADTVTMVNVAPESQTPHYMSKHDITTKYAGDDGLTELFMLYENIHASIQDTANRLKLGSSVKNFQTIGNAANQIGVGAISKGLGMVSDKKSEEYKLSQYKLAQYLYPSSGYALLDGYHYTINQLLNIDGGYCKNLKPCYPIIKDLVLDMDLQGAYVGSMKSLPFAVGIPCVYSFPKDRDYRPNFFQEYSKLLKKDLIYPGAWVARVTTTEKLSFKQDLIFSKIFGATDYEKALIDDGEGFFVLDDSLIDDLNDKKILAEIPEGAFQLLNNEIISGTMTHDVLQVIQFCWTKVEQQELWKKLRIDSMIFYNKKYLMDTETFKVEFEKLNDEIHHSFENGASTVTDKRKAIWTIIDTNDGWFGTLQNIRNEMKAEADKAKEIGEVEKATQLKAGQNGTKNINNSSYGVSGSVFYQTEKPVLTVKEDGTESYYANPKMGNVVFAQNTTARVRVGAWCMAKGLNGLPVVTDGTPFNLNEVWSWNWEGTNGHVFGSDYLWRLSRYNTSNKVDYKSRFRVKLEPLGGKKWEITNLNPDKELVTISNGEVTFTGKEEKWKELDEMAYQHVKSLFGELDIFKNDVMKYASKDLYKGAAFQSQANYLFERFFDSKKDLLGQPTTFTSKARGYNLSKLVHHLPNLEDEGVIHPYTKMLNDIYLHDIADVYIENVFSPQLLGVTDFNKTENVTADYIERGFLPHAPTFRSSKPSPFSLSMFRWNNRKQYEAWDKKVESWKSRTGFGIELLFLTVEMVKNRTPLGYSETINKIQNLIDANTNPSTFDERIREKLTTVIHPQLEREKTFE